MSKKCKITFECNESSGRASAIACAIENEFSYPIDEDILEDGEKLVNYTVEIKVTEHKA